MRLLLLPLLLLMALAGCSRGASPTSPDDTLDREAAGIYGGRVTLNGSVTTDPSYKDSPYTVTFPGKSGEVALITLSVTTIPAVTRDLQVSLRGVTVDYGSFTVPANGFNRWIAIRLTATEAFTISLSNSGVAGLHPEAAAWKWAVRTRPINDSGEPNDDENPTTFTDWPQATRVPFDRAAAYSVHQAADLPTFHDLEEWYRLDYAEPNHLVRVKLATTSFWGLWRYDLRIFDRNQQLLAERLDQLSNPTISTAGMAAPGPVFLQVVARLSVPRYGNVSVGEYTLTATHEAAPVWQTHLLTAPGTFQTVSLADAGGRLALAYRSSIGGELHVGHALTAVPSSPSDWRFYRLDPDWGSGHPTIRSHGGRLWVLARTGIWRANSLSPTGASDWAFTALFADRNPIELLTEDPTRIIAISDGQYAESQVADPQTRDDWWIYWLINAGDPLLAATMKDGRPAVLRRGLELARATVRSPRGKSHWAFHFVPGWGDSNADIKVWNDRFVVEHSNPIYDSQCPCYVGQEHAVSYAQVSEPAGPNDWAIAEFGFESLDDGFNEWTASQMAVKDGRLYWVSEMDGLHTINFGPVVYRSGDAGFPSFDHRPIYAPVTSWEVRRGSLLDFDGHLTVATTQGSQLSISYEIGGW